MQLDVAKRKPRLAPSTPSIQFTSADTLNISTHDNITITSVAMSTSELATSYAALILADDGVDITVRLPRCNSQSRTQWLI